MSDATALWVGFSVAVAFAWVAWRWAFDGDWLGAFWLGVLVAGICLLSATAHASTFAEREAYRLAHPRPPGATLLDRLPACEGLGYSDESPLWVPRGDDVRMVHEQLDLCALARRGALQSVATREALCAQIERLFFPLLKRAVCGVT